jgi:UTP--glucose-1-phosphate uridylyltransferase
VQRKVTKAGLGLGTRFLPATKSIPKEIMTLVDRPLIQYAIDEARAAGIKEFIFVTSRGKGALEDYFDHAPELEPRCGEGKTDLLEILKTNQHGKRRHRLYPPASPLGLGHAVWCANRLIGDEPFAVILPDDVIAAEKPCLEADDRSLCRNRRLHGRRDGGAAGAKASSYGILDIAEDMGSPLVKVRAWSRSRRRHRAVEPCRDRALHPDPQVLQNLNRMRPGAGGEIQLTDAIAEEIGRPRRSTATASAASASIADPRRVPAGDGGLRPRAPDLSGEFLAYLETLRTVIDA